MAEIFEKPKVFTKAWFSYVWDYYKWYIICGIAVIALSIFTYYDVKNTVKYDTNINFVATGVITSEKADEICAKCAQNSVDLNENGSVDISLTQLNFTEDNQKNSEMNYALTNKLMTLFASRDELIFITDSYMLERLTNMNKEGDVFLPVKEWAPDGEVIEGELAVSLGDSSVLKEVGIDSSDMYILMARADYEEGITPEEVNARKIAEFLIK